jgi:hypothetical protein
MGIGKSIWMRNPPTSTHSIHHGEVPVESLNLLALNVPVRFQQINSETFGEIDGVYVITASTKEENDRILKQVMDRSIRLNVKFNADNMQYIVSGVKYVRAHSQ